MKSFKKATAIVSLVMSISDSNSRSSISQCSPHSVVVMLSHFHYHTSLLPITLGQGFCPAAISCHLQRFSFSVTRGRCSHRDLYLSVLQAYIRLVCFYLESWCAMFVAWSPFVNCGSLAQIGTLAACRHGSLPCSPGQNDVISSVCYSLTNVFG